jgi:hypothetical protein
MNSSVYLRLVTLTYTEDFDDLYELIDEWLAYILLLGIVPQYRVYQEPTLKKTFSVIS